MKAPAAAARDALERAASHAPFLRALIDRHADLVELMAAGDMAAALARCGAGLDGVPAAAALRRERARTALVLAIGDLSGAFDFEQVTTALSDLADRALDRAIATAIAERTPDAPATGFAAIALGKHGSRELN